MAIDKLTIVHAMRLMPITVDLIVISVPSYL